MSAFCVTCTSCTANACEPVGGPGVKDESEVTALVDMAEANGIFPPFVTWARQRLQQRAKEEGRT